MTKAKKVVLKSGIKWEVYFAVDGRNSKRVRRRFDRKVDADHFIKNSTTQSLAIVESTSIVRTLLSESEYWMKIRESEVSASHLIRIKGILTKLLKNYSDLKIKDINHLFLADLRSQLLSSGLRPATVNRWTNVLTTIVNFSFKSNRITQNLCTGFGLLNEFRSEMTFWEIDDVTFFLNYTKKKYKGKKRWIYCAYLLSLNTGIRASEMWGLKVKDINFERSFISIERQLLGVNKNLAPTKGKNIRKVPCNTILMEELSCHINAQNLVEDDFLFQSSTKSPIQHNNFRNRYFISDLKSSDSPFIRFHDLRHTALTLMVESGINLKVVQSIAGHADIKTTMKYVHLLGDSIEKVAKSFSLSSD